MSGPDRPYRSPTTQPQRAEAPTEFVYSLGHPADEHGGLRTLVPAFLAGAIACGVLGRYGYLDAGIGVFVVVAALAWWRAARRASGVVIRVRDGLVLVYPWKGARRASVVSLEDLHDVRLDTKVIHRAQRETRPGVFAPGGYAGSLPVDVSRITLVCAPTADPIVLTKAYASHSETVERIAKMKTFLRARGWLPRDEREELGGEPSLR